LLIKLELEIGKKIGKTKKLSKLYLYSRFAYLNRLKEYMKKKETNKLVINAT